MRYLHPLKAGLSVGIVLGLWHACWAALVALGWAKPFMDFVLKLHFIHLQYDLNPYAGGTAAALVALTFTVGLVVGILFASVWNWLGAAPSGGKARSARAGA